jgi:lactam utilization protein B
VAIEQAVVQGISRHGDDFVIVVEKTPKPPSDAAAATAQTSPAGPESVHAQRSYSAEGNFVSSAGGASLPAHSQPEAEVIGRPSDPRD